MKAGIGPRELGKVLGLSADRWATPNLPGRQGEIKSTARLQKY